MMAADTKIARASASVRAHRGLRFVHTRLRELRMIAKALVSTKHPILVHVIPNRRCNLACTYCNEFDDFSKPVPLEEMKSRTMPGWSTCRSALITRCRTKFR